MQNNGYFYFEIRRYDFTKNNWTLIQMLVHFPCLIVYVLQGFDLIKRHSYFMQNNGYFYIEIRRYDFIKNNWTLIQMLVHFPCLIVYVLQGFDWVTSNNISFIKCRHCVKHYIFENVK